MANGVRRNKLKKMLSPSSPSNPPESVTTIANQEELMDDLFAELDNRSPTVQVEAAKMINDIEMQKAAENESAPGTGKSSKQRFKDREARRQEISVAAQASVDTEADAKLEMEASLEEAAINKICQSLSLEIQEIPPDGHCLFAAVADQLHILSLLPSPNYKIARVAAASYMLAHPQDFIPFIPSIEGEDGFGATDSSGVLTPSQFEAYCNSVRDTGVWGGEPEILALSRRFEIPIMVVQSGPQPIVWRSPRPDMELDPSGRAVKISYHRRMYGLGEHYNSLRPKAKGYIQSLF